MTSIGPYCDRLGLKLDSWLEVLPSINPEELKNAQIIELYDYITKSKTVKWKGVHDALIKLYPSSKECGETVFTRNFKAVKEKKRSLRLVKDKERLIREHLDKVYKPPFARKCHKRKVVPVVESLANDTEVPPPKFDLFYQNVETEVNQKLCIEVRDLQARIVKLEKVIEKQKSEISMLSKRNGVMYALEAEVQQSQQNTITQLRDKEAKKKTRENRIQRHLVTMADGEANAAKKVCPSKKIGTHNGTFHCDEVFACYMLKQLPEYSDADIIRTRDPAKLDECDIVVDVGGVFDASKHRYDHHQRSFAESMSTLSAGKKWVTKLSSAGLVYLHFGHRVLAGILGTKPADDITNVIYDKVYELFVEEVDAIDNGISTSDEKPRYAITSNLSSRVGRLNPSWNETENVDPDKLFRVAMKLVGSEFTDRVTFYRDSWLPARELVVEAINKRKEVDPSGEIIKLVSGGCPWKDHLMTLEGELEIATPIKFVLFTDQSGKWRIQCVPEALGGFSNRLSLLEKWRGVRDEELSTVSGIPGCIFVHASGFIGGNATYEGVLEMARQTLAAAKTESS